MTLSLTIERSALHEALTRIGRAVESKNIIPILSHFLLEARDGALHLAASNMDVEIRVAVPADIKSPGACAASAERFSAAVGSLAQGAHVSLDHDGVRLTMKSGRAKFTLMTLDPRDFPDIRLSESTHEFTLPAKGLVSLFAATECCILANGPHAILDGICLSIREDEDGLRLRAVAADGHRASRMEIAAPDAARGMPAIIVPRKAVGEIKRLAEKEGADLNISVGLGKITVSDTSGAVLTSRLVDGVYPEWDRMVSAPVESRIVIDREALLASVKRASAMSGAQSTGVKFEIRDETIRVSLRNVDAGESVDEIECDYAGEPIEVGFSVRYLTEMLAALASDRIVMRIGESKFPAIIQRFDDGALLMRLSSMNA